MPADVRVVPSEECYFESFRAALDTVARKRQYLIFLEAPPLATIHQYVSHLRRDGGVQMFALAGAANARHGKA